AQAMQERLLDRRVHNSGSRSSAMLSSIIFAVIALALSGISSHANAQQVRDSQPQVAVKTDKPIDDAKADDKKADDQPLTERERLLLERLDKLEQRLAELESRARAKVETAANNSTEAASPTSKVLPSDAKGAPGAGKALGIPVDPARLSGRSDITSQGE